MSKASAYFTSTDINGKRDGKELKRELDTLRGVLSVSVNSDAESIAVDFDTTGTTQEQIQRKIEKLGYKISHTRLENHVM